MNDKKLLSVLEIEKITKIPNATIRRYIRNHGHHLNIRKKGKSYLIAADSVDLVNQIRELYDQGKTVDQVDESLKNAGIPMTVDMTDGDQMMTVNVSEALQGLQKNIDELKEINQSLVDQLKKQQEYIDKKINDRDYQLMETMNHLLEAKQETASTTENPKKKRWWEKLFSNDKEPPTKP